MYFYLTLTEPNTISPLRLKNVLNLYVLFVFSFSLMSAIEVVLGYINELIVLVFISNRVSLKNTRDYVFIFYIKPVSE